MKLGAWMELRDVLLEIKFVLLQVQGAFGDSEKTGWICATQSKLCNQLSFLLQSSRIISKEVNTPHSDWVSKDKGRNTKLHWIQSFSTLVCWILCLEVVTHSHFKFKDKFIKNKVDFSIINICISL